MGKTIAPLAASSDTPFLAPRARPEGLDRIEDSEWKAQLEAGEPDDVEWMRSLIAR